MGVRGSCTLFSYFPFEIFYNIKGPRKQEFSTPIFHSPLFCTEADFLSLTFPIFDNIIVLSDFVQKSVMNRKRGISK